MKILIIRFSSIGDIVLASPVVRCVAMQRQAEVFFLTKSSFAAIPAALPHVKKVYALGAPPAVVHDRVRCETSFDALLDLLKTEVFDYIIDLHHNLRSYRVKRALKRPSFAYNKLNIEKWLLVHLHINRLPNVHIVDRYMQTVAPLMVHYDGQGLDFPIPVSVSTATEAILSEKWPVLLRQPFVAFVIGATHATKRLPLSKIIAIAGKITVPVALLGGPDEAVQGRKIAESVPNAINLCGELSLWQSAEMIRRSVHVITHDTGLMHIAAALHKPIVSVWGNTVPEFGMYPFYPEGMSLHTTVEVKGLPCRPCSKIGSNHCSQGHFRCMYDIPTDEVIRQIQA